MTARQSISDDDIGAPVIDTNETQVGTIVAVKHEMVTVQPETQLNDDALARGALGWDDPEATYAVDIDELTRAESSSGASFRIDLGEHKGGEADDEHLARGGPEPDDREDQNRQR